MGNGNDSIHIQGFRYKKFVIRKSLNFIPQIGMTFCLGLFDDLTGTFIIKFGPHDIKDEYEYKEYMAYFREDGWTQLQQ